MFDDNVSEKIVGLKSFSRVVKIRINLNGQAMLLSRHVKNNQVKPRGATARPKGRAIYLNSCLSNKTEVFPEN